MALTARKALGAFYTPNDAAHYMASWAVRASDEVLLEPSVGDGVFAKAAVEVATANGWTRPQFVACEINPEAAHDVIARGVVSATEVHVGDFLRAPLRPVDAVIGNPPYVRLRALPGDQSAAALGAFSADTGLRMEPSGSVWMPFVARAAKFLRTGGRLALVLPWDFTYVRYARPLWSHLARVFGSLRVVRVRERLFPDLSQDVLLLFADRKGASTERIIFQTFETVPELIEGRHATQSNIAIERVVGGDRMFQEALLPAGVADVLRVAEPLTVPTSELVTFNIGYVAGNKAFFHPDAAHALPGSSLVPAITDARSLKKGGLRTSGLANSTATNLWLPQDELDEAEEAYVRHGESLGVHRGYKTRNRDPWYVVPYVKVPDLVLSVFASKPVLMVNDGEYVATNSLLCGYLKQGSAEKYAAAWYSSLTLLNAELEVHSLGGGVLVLVPKEAGRVRVLRPELVDERALVEVEAFLREGNVESAYEAGDAALRHVLGAEAVDLLRAGIGALESWRVKG